MVLPSAAAAGEVNLPSGEDGSGGGGKKPEGEAAGAVEAVGDDVLGSIFLRLPDTASLARAALACKQWRRVASDRVLLRRFHSLHGGPPLLGVILSDGGNLRFVPVRSGNNPHLAAAANSGDFFFNSLPEHHFDSGDEEEGNGIRREPWMLRGCDGGLLLLSRGRDLAVYDPFARTAVFFRAPGGFSWVLHYALLADEADAEASFRAVAVQFLNNRVDAAVFSSRTQDWSPLPSIDVPHPWKARDGVRAGRFAYWQSHSHHGMGRFAYHKDDQERVLVLDTVTMDWSLLQVPFPVGEPYCAAEMAEYGGLCLVVGSKKLSCLQIWVSVDGGWTMMNKVLLRHEFPLLNQLRNMIGLRPLAVRGDYVFMEFWTFSFRQPRHYLLLINLKTMKLELVKNDSSWPYMGYANNRGSAFPFFMSWAPP